VLFLEWDFGNRDFGPIAARVKDANPDLVWIGDIGLEGNMLLDAMKKIDYAAAALPHCTPRPAHDQVARGQRRAGHHHLRGAPAVHDNPAAAAFVKTFNERAAKAGLPDTHVEVQAAASFSAWQILEAGVRSPQGLDDKKIATYLRKNKDRHHPGPAALRRPGNYGDDLMKIKQVQGGKWKVVWPQPFAAPGAKLQTRGVAS
jgi:ABC-type branched-subunit amino acid transport system substrate-binding protein